MIHGYIVIRKRSGADGPQFPVKKSVKIGRGTHCDVRIHVQSVSEQHCLILVEKDKRAMIQNLSLTSQTLVNGVPIGKGTCALKHGDAVTVGERSFQWLYGQQTPYYEGKKGSLLKRRKSEADTKVLSQNVAVVVPMYHKRKTLGPNITYNEPKSRTPKMSLKTATSTDLYHKDQTPPNTTPGSSKGPARFSFSKTPRARKSEGKVGTPSKTPTKSPSSRTPAKSAKRASILKSPTAATPAKSAKRVSILKSPTATTPAKTPVQQPPTGKSPAPKSPSKRSSPKLPGAKNTNKSPAGKSPAPQILSGQSPAAKTPAKSPAPKPRASKSPSTAVLMLGQKSPAKTPRTVLTAKRKSKSIAKTAASKSATGQKRRRSSPGSVVSKRLKIESPKSIDKKKMAILRDIHGRAATSSTLSTVKVVLSAKKTPIVKSIKTPRSSTVKKGATVKSSVKKARRPLFSEILKKKAVQTVNNAAKKLNLAPKLPSKAMAKKTEKPPLSTVIPLQFKFGSTGHANSPESIFIGRKVAKTPVVTKKGRKAALVSTKDTKGRQNLSGVSELFKTPAKTVPSPMSPAESGKRSSRRSSTPSSAKPLGISRSSSLSPSGTPKIVLTSPTKRKATPVKSPSSAKTPVGSTSRRSSTPSNTKPSSILKNSAASAKAQESKSTVRTPRVSILMSGSKRHAVLTSTPAVFGKRHSYAESGFESPSSVLTGQVSTPQSPASGRKSRLDMVAPRTSYVHSPHASPIKSSLKSSPAKSPEKNLSVSFNDSIHIKMLVSGSRKSLNKTAPLSSPNSPQSERSSGIATPDVTTFDFDSVKTPNVPREMFVSSILSSGTSSNSSPALGSAKRKGKPQKSPLNDLSDVQGVKLLMKTPTSPAGYVDMRGVKRLMTAASKTPSYIAVDGVKKLFGDATAAARIELSSFPGVQELFASPSPPGTKSKLSIAASPRRTPLRSSPVAKIQAEVENKGRSSSDSTSGNSARASSRRAISNKDSPAKSTPASSTPRGRRTTRKRTESSTAATPVVHEEKEKPRRGRAPAKVVPEPPIEKSPVKEVAARRTRKAAIVSSPKATEPKSPVSPPKRRTRKAATVSSSPKKSPAQDVPKARARRGAGQSAAAKKQDKVSPAKSPKASPVKAATKKAAPKTPSPVKTPPTKRTTRRGGKAATGSPNTKVSSKRALSPSQETTESPVKRTRKEVVKSTSPVKASPKRATRKTKASPKEEAPVKNATPSGRKRKAVSFEDEVASPKKEKTTRKTKTTKKATSPAKAPSPRRTRSRK